MKRFYRCTRREFGNVLDFYFTLLYDRILSLEHKCFTTVYKYGTTENVYIHVFVYVYVDTQYLHTQSFVYV